VKTPLKTRAFLLCFVPFTLLLGSSFWMIQRSVQSTVREGLRTSLRENQVAIASIHAKADLQKSRFLKIAGENTALKAGVQLLLAHPGNASARNTVEDQLRELGEHMGFDFMLVSAPDRTPLAGVVRENTSGANGKGQLVPVDLSLLDRNRGGFLFLEGRTFQVAAVPVDEDDENIALLCVGEYFSLSDINLPMALVHDGKVVESNIPHVTQEDLARALIGCNDQSECDVLLQFAHWIVLPMESYRGGYRLLSLENVDAATAPIQSRLRQLFVTLAGVSLLVALLCSIGSSSSIVKPIAAIVGHLRTAARTGKLVEIQAQNSSIQEIQELAEIYNRAAISVRKAGECLESAYLEFVGSLAHALDARDQYTAGHSWRVSQLSCATAEAMHLKAEDVQRIRIGALLHDIGKIGVADSVLQKPGRLTDEEFDQVKQHPVIGRRILEGVQGFAPYLAAVELHHENWNGTGYPKGQRAEETPIDARIIHVSDAYDAMTTNRSYRRGMSHEKAISILVENAGIQFDPRIVATFVALPVEVLKREPQGMEKTNEAEQSPVAVAV
jgi:HD-GYP domain-containing protein (c-di-GMP phosphodiesterase class II)